MSEAQLLYQLQTIDLAREEVSRAIQSIADQLVETEELIGARQALTDLQDQLKTQQSAMKDLNWELDTTTRKLKDLETKLYGGTVKNPKELGNLEHEVQLLRQKKSHTEDKLLELMDQVDTSQISVQAAKNVLVEVEAAWERQQASLQEEQTKLQARCDELTRSRQALERGLRTETLAIYDDLRANKRGRAVAKVEQNTCQGCRITLPTNEVITARSSPKLVFCSSCGRILLALR